MADTKISALTAVTTPAATDEFAVNQGGTSKKETLQQVADFVGTVEGWRFLGTTELASSNVLVGPIIWTGTYRQFMVRYFISGYNSAAIGRFQMGVGSISTTALTNGSQLTEGVTAPSSAVSIPGVPLAVTLTAIARRGWIYVEGKSGAFKQIEVHGSNGNQSVSAAPTLFRAVSWFSDLSTNLAIQRMQLASYTSNTATSTGGTFNSGSYLSVWGRNND